MSARVPIILFIIVAFAEIVALITLLLGLWGPPKQPKNRDK